MTSTESTPRGTILVIDDAELNRSLLERVLERAGFACTLAETARAGLDALEANPHDAVLLDLCMPDMDGMDFLAELRRLGLLPGLPVVMLTGIDEPQVRAQALDNGAIGFLPKPFDRRSLLRLLEEHVQRR